MAGSHRDHLRRLSPENYRGHAIVHWTLTIRDRKTGWLDPRFYYRFRELLTHTCFRYGVACPTFCIMPDHLHLIWMGLQPWSDQLVAMKHFRKSINRSLAKIGFEFQDQAYDHVFRDSDDLERELHETCEYISQNPVRAGLVGVDQHADYPYTDCLLPGYPDLRRFDPDFWIQLDRVVSFLKREGLQRSGDWHEVDPA